MKRTSEGQAQSPDLARSCDNCALFSGWNKRGRGQCCALPECIRPAPFFLGSLNKPVVIKTHGQFIIEDCPSFLCSPNNQVGIEMVTVDNSLFVRQLSLEECMREKLWELVFKLSEECPATHFQKVIKPECEECKGEYWKTCWHEWLDREANKKGGE